MTSDAASVSLRPDLKGSIAQKVAAVRKEGTGLYDLVLVHRDADRAGLDARTAEVRSAGGDDLVPVVPVTMTETWALADLLDDSSCSTWLRRQEGVSLGTLENIGDSKTLLHRLLGRHEPHDKLVDDSVFGAQRARILSSLNLTGSVRQLPAWQALVHELSEAIQRVRPWVRPGPPS